MKPHFLLFAFFPFITFAQSYDADALKFSNIHTSGSARSMGVAGAFGSVGADLSTTLSNPAGIALYRSSEVSAGFGIHATTTNNNFLNQDRRENRTRFSFYNAGFVYAGAVNKKSKAISFSSSALQYVNFALTYNRLSNFHRDVFYEGVNRNNSYAGAWVNELNGLGNDLPSFQNASVASVLALQNETVRFDTFFREYFTYIDTPLTQRGTIRERGSLDEMNLALGFNINDKVFFAFNAGIPFLTYSATNDFSETDDADNIPRFSRYRFVQEYRTNGIGFNLKLGLIYRPVAWYRTGVAFHLPTWFRLDENYYAYLDETFDGFQYFKDADAAPFRYNVHTPMRGIFSNSFYFKQYGFLSVDYEFQNFGALKHRFGSYPEEAAAINSTVKSKYGFGHTVRVGVEGALKWFRVRGGYAWQSSPFAMNAREKGFNEQRHMYSFGVGYRGNRFFADMAFQQMLTNSYYQQYSTTDGNPPGVKTKNAFTNVLLTFGWRFSTKNQ